MADSTATKEFDRLAAQVAAGEDFANIYGRPNYLEEMAQAEAWRNGEYGPQYASAGAGYVPARNAEYGMLPPVHQRTPYATMAYQVGDTPWGGMSVRNLVGEPSPFPHVLRGYGEDFTRVMPYLGMMGMLYPWTYYGAPPMPPMPRGGGYGGGGGGAARASVSAGATAGNNQPSAKPATVDLQPILDLANGVQNSSGYDWNPVIRTFEDAARSVPATPTPAAKPVIAPTELPYDFDDTPLFAAGAAGPNTLPTAKESGRKLFVPTEDAELRPAPTFGADMHTMNDATVPPAAFDWSPVINATSAFTPQGTPGGAAVARPIGPDMHRMNDASIPPYSGYADAAVQAAAAAAPYGFTPARAKIDDAMLQAQAATIPHGFVPQSYGESMHRMNDATVPPTYDLSPITNFANTALSPMEQAAQAYQARAAELAQPWSPPSAGLLPAATPAPQTPSAVNAQLPARPDMPQGQSALPISIDLNTRLPINTTPTLPPHVGGSIAPTVFNMMLGGPLRPEAPAVAMRRPVVPLFNSELKPKMWRSPTRKNKRQRKR